MKLLNTYQKYSSKPSAIYIPTGANPYLTRCAIAYICNPKELLYSFLSNSELLLRISLPEHNLVKVTKQDSF